MIIDEPCGPGMGFDNCATFHDRRWTIFRIGPEDLAWEWDRVCPWHDLLDYDYNRMRIIKKIKDGIRVGLGPSKADLGFDVRCCVM